ncbi:hypothetical protein HYN51_00285 [Limnobaculum parvum]|uniref:Uncharacterized protein n=1 Tax=Limnobaculum parvum TaxID=2172103 RepID=A0A2Y9TUG7_9GAMM|nr:hypothetical protein HYN51_00285 [Limnobaculum parvum]
MAISVGASPQIPERNCSAVNSLANLGKIVHLYEEASKQPPININSSNNKDVFHWDEIRLYYDGENHPKSINGDF